MKGARAEGGAVVGAGLLTDGGGTSEQENRVVMNLAHILVVSSCSWKESDLACFDEADRLGELG